MLNMFDVNEYRPKGEAPYFTVLYCKQGLLPQRDKPEDMNRLEFGSRLEPSASSVLGNRVRG